MKHDSNVSRNHTQMSSKSDPREQRRIKAEAEANLKKRQDAARAAHKNLMRNKDETASRWYADTTPEPETLESRLSKIKSTYTGG